MSRSLISIAGCWFLLYSHQLMLCSLISIQTRKYTGPGTGTVWNLKFGSENFQSLFFPYSETMVLQMKRLGFDRNFSFLFREDIWLSKRKMSFRLWVAVVQACSVLVIPSKGKIRQWYIHHTKKKKKEGQEKHTLTCTSPWTSTKRYHITFCSVS